MSTIRVVGVARVEVYSPITRSLWLNPQHHKISSAQKPQRTYASVFLSEAIPALLTVPRQIAFSFFNHFRFPLGPSLILPCTLLKGTKGTKELFKITSDASFINLHTLLK